MAPTGTSPKVAYRALADELRSALASGEYADGRRLPTEAELAASHGLSRQTVRRAMQDLVAEGAVYRVPGRGTFAAEDDGQYLRRLGSVDDLLNLSIDTELEVVQPLRRRVDVDVASRLRLKSDSLYALTFRRMHHAEPICYTATYLPPRIGDLLTDVAILQTPGATTSSTVIGFVEARMPGVIGSADQSITVGRLPEEAAEAIGGTAGDPMLRIDRVYLDAQGQPVELAINWYDPAKFTYRVQLRRS
jgi:GntR family transcriptional regulator